jgi:putative transposase
LKLFIFTAELMAQWESEKPKKREVNMKSVFTRIYVHIIIAVKSRLDDFQAEKKHELENFMTEFLRRKGCTVHAISSLPDHSHILTELDPDIIADVLVRDIKASSSRFLNQKKWFPVKFRWHKTFAIFSCSPSNIRSVSEYINNQENYHQVKSFAEEYHEILTKLKVSPVENYLFPEMTE